MRQLYFCTIFCGGHTRRDFSTQLKSIVLESINTIKIIFLSGLTFKLLCRYAFIFLDDTPTRQLLTLLDVPDLDLSLRIKDGIRNYVTVGTFLLNDAKGVIMDRIRDTHKRVEDVVDEVFNRWLSGEGQNREEKSNTWGKLVESLKYAEEMDLANKIESVISFCINKRDKNCVVLGSVNHIQEKSTNNEYFLILLLTVIVVIGSMVIIYHRRKYMNQFSTSYNF